MPEIWFPYGREEIVVNIKAENINQVFESSEKQLEDDELTSRLEKVDYPDIIIHEGSKYSKKLLDILSNRWGKMPKIIEVPPYSFSQVNDNDNQDVLVDGSMLKLPSYFFKGKVLVISAFHFDPIFGFFGPHILLASASGMLEESIKRWDRKINPGSDTDAGWFAMRLCNSIPHLSALAFIKGQRGAVELRYGTIENIFNYMKDYMQKNRVRSAQHSRLSIIGAGGDSNDRTFASSLLAVSNNIGALSDDSEILIVAECREGLGSYYLRKLADGALPGKDSNAWEEELMKALTSKGRLHLVSTLPKSIVEKRLKIKAYSSLREAFDAIQAEHAWRFKANIFVDSSSFLAAGNSN